MRIGDPEADFPGKEIGEKRTADFRTPSVEKSRLFDFSISVDLPAYQLTQIGVRPHELLGHSFLQAEIGKSQTEKLAQNLFLVAVLRFFNCGELLGRKLLGLGDALENDVRVSAVVRTVHVSRGGQFLNVRGLSVGKFDQEVVPHDLAGGLVLRFRLFLAPEKQFSQHRQISR